MDIQTMTVQELRQILSTYPSDLPIAFSYPSGDHWGTKLAGTIKEVEEGEICYSDYHEKFQVAEEPDEEEDIQTILILKGDTW